MTEIKGVPITMSPGGQVVGYAEIGTNARGDIVANMTLTAPQGHMLVDGIVKGYVREMSLAPAFMVDPLRPPKEEMCIDPANVSRVDKVTEPTTIKGVLALEPAGVPSFYEGNAAYGEGPRPVQLPHPHIADFDLDPSNQSVGSEEIENRFGFHKGTLEGPNATAPRHAYLRREFKDFADMLDRVLPPGRAKEVAFVELETASMWTHKAIAQTAPVQEG